MQNGVQYFVSLLLETTKELHFGKAVSRKLVDLLAIVMNLIGDEEGF